MKILKTRTQKRSLFFLSAIISLSILNTGCISTENKQQSEYTATHASEAQYAIGKISSADLIANFPAFAKGYSTYQPSKEAQQVANNIAEDVSIKVFFGSWCHDSIREVPRFLKTFDHSNASIELIGLDTKKEEPLGLKNGLNIKFTPTIIVFKNGSEVGRIIERPKKSLANDIQSFLL